MLIRHISHDTTTVRLRIDTKAAEFVAVAVGDSNIEGPKS